MRGVGERRDNLASLALEANKIVSDDPKSLKLREGGAFWELKGKKIWGEEGRKVSFWSTV